MLETVELLIIKFESNLEVWISSLRVRNCNLQLEIRIWNHQNWNKNLYNWSINQKYWLAFQYLETHHFFSFFIWGNFWFPIYKYFGNYITLPFAGNLNNLNILFKSNYFQNHSFFFIPSNTNTIRYHRQSKGILYF